MSTPTQRYERALENLDRTVSDRQEQAQREEWEFMQKAAEKQQQIYEQYVKEQDFWLKAQMDAHPKTTRQQRRNGLWETS